MPLLAAITGDADLTLLTRTGFGPAATAVGSVAIPKVTAKAATAAIAVDRTTRDR